MRTPASHAPRTPLALRRLLATALFGAMLAPLVVAAPASAQEVEPPDDELETGECPTSNTVGLTAADEFAAYELALACGAEVEVLDQRDVDRQSFATPEGVIRAAIAAEPLWVRDASGAWVDIDPTFAVRPDGSAASTATIVDIEVGAGVAAPFVTATDPDGGSLALTWPLGSLPSPEVDGAVAAYREVLPGVDLEVQALPVGFAWVLVVGTPEAAAHPALASIEIGIDADGLTVSEDDESGGLVALNSAGERVFEAGQAIMWDSPAEEDAFGDGPSSDDDVPIAEPRRVEEVATELTESGLELTPDMDMLVDPETEYPVYVDPNFTSTRYSWANVFQGKASTGWTGDSSWPRSGGMRVGLNTWSDCGDGCGLWRSVVTLNIGGISGRYIAKADVKMTQTHMGGCADRYLQLWRVSKHENNVSWNGVNWLYGSALQSKLVPSSNKTGCSGKTNESVTFNNSEVKSRVQSAADNKYTTISFGLRSSNETNRDAWRRIDIGSVKLEVEYYVYPPKPDQLKVNGTSCTSSLSTAKWTTSRYPGLSARIRTSESERVNVRFRTRKSGADSNFYFWETAAPIAASTLPHTVKKSHPDGNYYWQARSEARQSSSVNSSYSSACYFKIDGTKPSTPTVRSDADGPLVNGDDVTLTLSSSDPTVNGVRSGLKGFQYSWGSPTFKEFKASSGQLVLTEEDISNGRHVLYVRSIDNAGNLSGERKHTFFVGTNVDAYPAGMWRFEGDVFDDSDSHNRRFSEKIETDDGDYEVEHVEGLIVTDPAGATFATDADGRTGAAISRTAAGCLETENPVLETDAAYTITAWVKVTNESAAGNPAIVTQAGKRRPAFYLEFNRSAGKWNFTTPSQDADTVTWQHLHSTSPAQYGVWTHVAVTLDADAQVSRIYIDGQLEGERFLDHLPWHADGPLLIGCAGRTEGGGRWHQMAGAIDQVGVWEGLLSPAEIQAAANDLPTAFEQARWTFRDAGRDDSPYGRDLELPDGLPVGEDAYTRPEGSVELDGQTCLEYPEPALSTDRSLTVASWVRFDEVDNIDTIVAVSGADNTGVRLRKLADGRIQFRLTSHDAREDGSAAQPTVWQRATPEDQPLEPGRWYHVAGVYDSAAGSMSLYLDGLHVSSRTVPQDLWQAAGPTTIGCSGRTSDQSRWHYMKGSLHDVRLWRGAVDADQLQAMMGNPPVVSVASWDFDWVADDGTPDLTGNGHDLSYHGSWDWGFGKNNRADSALWLEGLGYGTTPGPVIATDESYTVSALVHLDDSGTDQVIVSQSSSGAPGFYLKYRAALGKWEMAVPRDVGASSWYTARSDAPADFDDWVLLVGVFDLAAGEVRLYVNGVHQETVKNATGFNAPGPMIVGSARNTSTGETWNPMTGLVDRVFVWRGALSETVIANMFDPDMGGSDEL
jgi:hypothetical protein